MEGRGSLMAGYHGYLMGVTRGMMPGLAGRDAKGP